jgi:hypothetical protein
VAVKLEQATEARSTTNPTSWPVLVYFMARKQQDVASPLMISLPMKIVDKLGQGASQRGFAEQDQFR